MITTKHIVAMIQHWLATPPNGYFGSSYGNNLAEQLLKNTEDYVADAFLEKLKSDIPILERVQIDVVEEHLGFERVNVYLQIGETLIPITTPNIDPNQDFYHVTAS